MRLLALADAGRGGRPCKAARGPSRRALAGRMSSSCSPTTSGPTPSAPGATRTSGRRTSTGWSARVQLPRQLLLRLEQRGRLRAEPGHADEREDLARRGAGPRRGEAPAGVLREGGYATFATGKWHNGEPSLVRAFPDARSVFFGGMADHTKVPVADVRDGKVDNRRVAEKFSSEQFADAAIDFLESPARRRAVLLLRGVHRAPRSAQPAREVPGDVLQGPPAAPGELPPAAPLRQRHDEGRPRREPGPLSPHPRGHQRPALRVLRPDHPPRRAGRPHPGGAGGIRAGREHRGHLHRRPRPGDGQPRAPRQAEPLRAQHAVPAHHRGPRHPRRPVDRGLHVPLRPRSRRSAPSRA